MKIQIRVGIIGMGGYAGIHHQALLRLEEAGDAKLVCTCDPNPTAFVEEQARWNFERRGVKVFDDYRAMLAACANNLDLVVIATPIPLHAEMHRACVDAGLASYLEKPPTLDYCELETMLQTERRAVKRTLVGFNFIIEPERLALKKRLLEGAFGKIVKLRFSALWGRPQSYFQCNAWRGRLKMNERLVLDSCFGNAMGHFVHNMLFWTGKEDLFSWAKVGQVQARLYRAYQIEGADTFFVEAICNGVPLRFALSHATTVNRQEQLETVECDLATICYRVGRGAEVFWKDGSKEVLAFGPFDTPFANHRDYYRYLRGGARQPANTLENSAPFVHLNDLAYISSQTIRDIPRSRLSVVPHEDASGDFFLSIKGVDDLFQNFLQGGLWPALSS
jgi:predicted dehydrogenase